MAGTKDTKTEESVADAVSRKLQNLEKEYANSKTNITLQKRNDLGHRIRDLYSTSTTARIDINARLASLAPRALSNEIVSVLEAAGATAENLLDLVNNQMTSKPLILLALSDASTATEDKVARIPELLKQLLQSEFELATLLHKRGISTEDGWPKLLTAELKTLASFQLASWSQIMAITERQKPGSKMTPGETRVLSDIYATDSAGVPDIRKQVLASGMPMKVAEELENINVLNAEDITPEIRDNIISETTSSTLDGTKMKAKLSSMTAKAVENEKKKNAAEDEKKLAAHRTEMLALKSSREEMEKQRKGTADDLIKKLQAMDVSKLMENSTAALKKELNDLKEAVKAPEGFGNMSPEGLEDSAATLEKVQAMAGLGSFSGESVIQSCKTKEDLVSWASGGLALYGINCFSRIDEVIASPPTPLLSKPKFVESSGPSQGFEARVHKTTHRAQADAFVNTARSAGISMAESSNKEFSASATVGYSVPFAGSVQASAAYGQSSEQNKAHSEETSSSGQTRAKQDTRTAAITEYIKCPMMSFRIPKESVCLSYEALECYNAVDSVETGAKFLDSFGSHISLGRHALGGVFFRTVTMTSTSDVQSELLFAAAGDQMSSSKKEARNISGSVAGGYGGFSASAAASYGSASSSGTATFNSSSSGKGSESTTSTALFETYVNVMGPQCPTPEAFASMLFTNDATWHVMDRGPLEALVPVWELLEAHEAEQLVATGQTEDVEGGATLAKVETTVRRYTHVRKAWEERVRRGMEAGMYCHLPEGFRELALTATTNGICDEVFGSFARHICRLLRPADGKPVQPDKMNEIIEKVAEAATSMPKVIAKYGQTAKVGVHFCEKLRRAREKLLIDAGVGDEVSWRIVESQSCLLTGMEWDNFAQSFANAAERVLLEDKLPESALKRTEEEENIDFTGYYERVTSGAKKGTPFSGKKGCSERLGRINQIKVFHEDSVNGIGLAYASGKYLSYGGERGKHTAIINLAQGEFVTGISGSSGSCLYRVKFYTNLSAYGPYGTDKENGRAFSIHRWFKTTLRYIFGHADDKQIFELGFGFGKQPPALEIECTQLFGGKGGSAFNDSWVFDNDGPICGIFVYYDQYVSGLYTVSGGEKNPQYGYGHGCVDGYKDKINLDGVPLISNVAVGAKGRKGRKGEYIDLKPGEYVCKIDGRCGGLLDQITFHTRGTCARTFGPYGGETGGEFTVDFGTKALLYFFGREAASIDALGFASGNPLPWPQ